MLQVDGLFFFFFLNENTKLGGYGRQGEGVCGWVWIWEEVGEGSEYNQKTMYVILYIIYMMILIYIIYNIIIINGPDDSLLL